MKILFKIAAALKYNFKVPVRVLALLHGVLFSISFVNESDSPIF